MFPSHLPLIAYLAAAPAQFSLGVAAGDLTDHSALVWTRADAPGDILFELATDADFANVVYTFFTSAEPDLDLTVKTAGIDNLKPRTTYYYRFSRLDDPSRVSAIGHFHTAPAPDTTAPLRFVFSGDTNYAYAPFVAVGAAADEGADFCIWFGDTIYADVPAGGLGVATTPEEYRAKYRQVRSDPNVQKLLASTPAWLGRDDHEVRNDYSPKDPDLSPDQLGAAYNAFFLYTPSAHDSFQSFRYGSLTEFFMLDERQYRDVSAQTDCGDNPDPLGFLLGPLTLDRACADLLSAPREMLGETQFAWLKEGLKSSTAAVKFVVNNVPLSHIGVLPYDRWDGYDAQRRDLLEFIDASQIQNVVFLTTDIHANALNPDLGRYFRAYRPDYHLPNHVVMAEIIAGPWGNQTLRSELLEEAGSVLHLPQGELTQEILTSTEGQLVQKIRDENGMMFVDDDRVGYAVIEVTADGQANLTYRGLDDNGNIETTYSGAVVPPQPPQPSPCGAPFLALGAMSACFAGTAMHKPHKWSAKQVRG